METQRNLGFLEGSELIRYMSTLSTSLSTLAGHQARVLSHMRGHCREKPILGIGIASPLALAWAAHKNRSKAVSFKLLLQ